MVPIPNWIDQPQRRDREVGRLPSYALGSCSRVFHVAVGKGYVLLTFHRGSRMFAEPVEALHNRQRPRQGPRLNVYAGVETECRTPAKESLTPITMKSLLFNLKGFSNL